jgi:hypothetical protein
MTTESRNRRKVAGVVGGALAGLLILVIVIAFIVEAPFGNPRDASADTQTPSPTASATPEPEQCEASWPMVTSDYENNRWASDGIPEIQEAFDAGDTKKAVEAVHAWLEVVRTDATLLKGAVKYYLHQDVARDSLINGQGCASEEAIDLMVQLDLSVANAKSIIPEAAPANGYNSGVNDGVVIGDTAPGIGGNRAAVKITLQDGTEIWIMARCGNVVTMGPPPVPPGTTDNPPRCPYNPELPPDSPDCLQPKKPEESSSQNPANPDWIKDEPGGGNHSVEYTDGATDSNGLQTNPQQDAQNAANAANQANQQNQQQHQEAQQEANTSGGGTVDQNQDNGASTPPPADW